MKRFPNQVPLLLLGLALACRPDPHKLKITEQNRENFMESIKDSKGLTVEETRLLIARQMRKVLAGDSAGKSLVGKTVGQLIEEERELQAKEKTEQDRRKRLAAEAKAKQDARAAELRKAITLSVFEKDFVPSNWQASRYEDYITFKVAYENTSGKDIRAFQGSIRFMDLFGAAIAEPRLTISDPIKAGAKATWEGSIKFNQFSDEDVRLRNTDLKDMRVEWRPASIIFEDGTRIGEIEETSSRSVE